jgi:hypothetical protein
MNPITRIILTFLGWGFLISLSHAQTDNFTTIRTEVDFNNKLREWDGFGFNYVEEAQYRVIDEKRQEYGGFSYLSEESKMEIIDMIFGEDGLQPGIVKMFLDPFHQENKPGGAYNHTKTTSNMLYFVENGLKTARAQGNDFQIITTLYGPPAYMTKQKVIRGRDFDYNHKEDLGNYLVSWANFLANERNLPLQYISLHNEGDDWQRWDTDGGDSESHYNHDYNMHWPPELVVDFLKFLPKKLSDAGLGHIGVTPGEPYAWDRFIDYGYANAIVENQEALNNLSLITSHGFMSWGWGRWNTYHTSAANDLIRASRPEMKSWVTSTSWATMDSYFVREIYGNIYTSKVNAIIPWAGIQRPGLWVGGDPNAGCAFNVHDDGTYVVRKGYYFYKQLTRAGRPGMAVARTLSMDPQVKIIAFSANGTGNPDSFIILNVSNMNKELNIQLKGEKGKHYNQLNAFRSTNDETEQYHPVGTFLLEEDSFRYTAPPHSVTTFFHQQ